MIYNKYDSKNGQLTTEIQRLNLSGNPKLGFYTYVRRYLQISFLETSGDRRTREIYRYELVLDRSRQMDRVLNAEFHGNLRPYRNTHSTLRD